MFLNSFTTRKTRCCGMLIGSASVTNPGNSDDLFNTLFEQNSYEVDKNSVDIGLDQASEQILSYRGGLQ